LELISLFYIRLIFIFRVKTKHQLHFLFPNFVVQ
jgi:hypothetical protein